jgi:hypothetical protein
VSAIEPRSAGRANDKSTVADRLPQGVTALDVREYVAAVNGHSPRPKTSGSRFANYGQFGFAHIFHRPSDGTDVP